MKYIIFSLTAVFLFFACNEPLKPISTDSDLLPDADTDIPVDTDISADKDTVPDKDSDAEQPDTDIPVDKCETAEKECKPDQTLECAILNPDKYSEGEAFCTQYCMWDTSSCIDIPPKKYYGLLSGAGNFGFILDGARIQDQNYLKQHTDGLVLNAVLSGNYGTDRHLPPSGATTVISLAAHDANEKNIYIIQQSLAGQTPIQPLLYITFQSDNITPGQYPFDFINESGAVYLTLTNDNCFLAVALGGTLNVTKAENTQAIDGGKLNFTSSEVILYYPTETPEGDISDILPNPVCPKE